MTRGRYREIAPLPAGLDLGEVGRIRAFLHRKTKVRCELVQLYTGDCLVSEPSLERALAALEPDHEVKMLEVAIFTERDDELAVALTWNPGGASSAEIAGTDEASVLGMGQVLGRYIERRHYRVAARATQLGGLRRRLGDVSVQVVGVVLGTGVLTLLGLLWTLFR